MTFAMQGEGYGPGPHAGSVGLSSRNLDAPKSVTTLGAIVSQIDDLNRLINEVADRADRIGTVIVGPTDIEKAVAGPRDSVERNIIELMERRLSAAHSRLIGVHQRLAQVESLVG